MAKTTKTPKKSYDPQFKAKVSIEALSQASTTEAVAKQFSINKTQANSWRNQLKDNAYTLFMKGKQEVYEDKQETIDNLQQLLGQEAMEIAQLKKKSR
ncbi:transposase [Chitinophaga silvisoli]|uniref:Transposase n=1 Tax=Chitinophaga silvisoli TaxID=2291814 RepID=A0A3E1NN64_9BACT|nr:transposase [Chitinophaga silvisoli]RFM29264.1 transposase [Chitinophaga silvisoli]